MLSWWEVKIRSIKVFFEVVIWVESLISGVKPQLSATFRRHFPAKSPNNYHVSALKFFISCFDFVMFCTVLVRIILGSDCLSL